MTSARDRIQDRLITTIDADLRADLEALLAELDATDEQLAARRVEGAPVASPAESDVTPDPAVDSGWRTDPHCPGFHFHTRSEVAPLSEEFFARLRAGSARLARERA